MINFFIENWQILIGVIATPVAWVFGGRMKQKTEAVSSMQDMYNGFLGDYKARMDEVIIEVNALRTHNKELQLQFNNIHLQYAKEVEQSQNWEKLHRELKDAYNKLQKDHDKLKRDFETYKSMHK
jgi:predicted nuclease with TOPRIM domain